MVVKRRTSAKNPPVLSHEFVIQNHADIVACLAMLFVVGLMFQVSSPLASLFIALHHNVTLPVEVPSGKSVDMVFYTQGIKDLPAIFFYLLIAVVMHQIIQEYMLDKINRRLHLSKIKHTKFNESGQLLAFYLMSIVWAGDLLMRENMLSSIRTLWEGYPHTYMTFMFKFFYIVQIAYWLHILPELYFQKVKREDMAPRIQYSALYLSFIGAAYFLSFTRVALCLLMLQYVAEALFHACRLLSFADKRDLAGPLYSLHTAVYVMARLGSISLAVLTFWYGLALAPKESQIVDLAAGAFNTPVFRLNALVAVGLLQAYLMWTFITFHLRRRKEGKSSGGAGGAATRNKKTQQEKAMARKEKKSDESDLTEVDQNTKKSLRQRK